MEGLELPQIAAIDIVAAALMVMGIIMGLLRGLGPVFGMLLWLLVALWLSTVITPVVLGWMPNSPSDLMSQISTFGLISGVLIILPAMARMLGGAGGKKKKDPIATYRPFGVLVGMMCAVIFFTLLTPYAYRMNFISKSYAEATMPALAEEVADTASWLFHDSHRTAIREAGKEASRRAANAQQAPR